ncbi:MAG: cupredoxin domain-containing protein [Actinomycetota bacterium]
MSKRKKHFIVLSVVALALVAGACGEEEADSGAQEQALEIEAFDNYYETETLLLEPGAEVTLSFSNGGGVAHSVTVPDLDFELEAQSGDTAESSFSAPDEPGSLDFYCKFHPDEMKGVISIGGADQPIEEDVDSEDDDDADVDVDVDEEDDADASGTDDPDY